VRRHLPAAGPTTLLRAAGLRGIGRALIALLLFAIAAAPARANDVLPTGFSAINVGAAWIDVEGLYAYTDLSDASTLSERLNQECGYKTVLMQTQDGELMVTINDFVVTDLSFATPLQPGSDLMAVANVVMQTYGQPQAATMRDALGKATLDNQRVNHVELRYQAQHPVTFYVSGAAVWRYQINVHYAQRRWHQNKNFRCARTRAKTLAAGKHNNKAASE
jgi:hypothetical protein